MPSGSRQSIYEERRRARTVAEARRIAARQAAESTRTLGKARQASARIGQYTPVTTGATAAQFAGGSELEEVPGTLLGIPGDDPPPVLTLGG